MIRILVDSSADYSIDEIKDNNFELVSMKINFGENEYVEGKNLERDEFYEKLQTETEFPKTSQPSPQDFLDVFEDVKSKGDEVICILLSSALSGTCQSALIAKNMVDYEGIYVFDSLSATACIKIMAEYAKKLISENKPADEIVKGLKDLQKRIKCIAVIDTLEYLHRGGRLSKTAAAVGEAVNIKPIITITEEGEVGIVKKCIGKKQAAMQFKRILKEYKSDKNFPAYAIYTYGTENVEAIEDKLEKDGWKLSERRQIGATIGTHVGHDAYGLIFVTEK